MRKALLTLVLMLFLAENAFAGGPFFVNHSTNGLPLLWKNNVLTWVVDSGDLNSSVTNSQAIQWVKELFDIWTSSTLESAEGLQVPVANLQVEYAGTVSEDITAGNYTKAINRDDTDAVVIFDRTGEIIDSQFGDKSQNYIVGFASPLSNRSDHIVGGIVVLNGLFIDGDDDHSNEVSEDSFKAAMLHEIGHLLNLDHTQANIEAVERHEGGDISLDDEIPTMYPVLYTKEQLRPKTDDKVALGLLYPTDAYKNSFCTITGELINAADGLGFQGADVVARALDKENEWSDVRTFVSGVMYPKNTANGEYILGGLIPNRKYVVGYRAIDAIRFTDGSSIAPYDPPRSGVIPGVISKEVIACTKGGDSSQMEKTSIESKSLTLGLDSDNNSDQTSPAGGCSLIR